jgi:hypothetical protein
VAPCTFKSVGVTFANNTVFVGVVHSLVLVTHLFDMALRTVFVGHNNRARLDMIRNNFAECCSGRILSYSSADFACTFSSANNRRFTARATAAHTVMLLAADVGFVSFDDVSESITVSGFAGRWSGCAGA